MGNSGSDCSSGSSGGEGQREGGELGVLAAGDADLSLGVRSSGSKNVRRVAAASVRLSRSKSIFLWILLLRADISGIFLSLYQCLGTELLVIMTLV